MRDSQLRASDSLPASPSASIRLLWLLSQYRSPTSPKDVIRRKRGSVLFGVILLLAFALGRAVPLAVGASAVSWLENLSGLARFRRGFEIAGGLTLIVMGLYMLNAVLFWVPALAM